MAYGVSRATGMGRWTKREIPCSCTPSVFSNVLFHRKFADRPSCFWQLSCRPVVCGGISVHVSGASMDDTPACREDDPEPERQMLSSQVHSGNPAQHAAPIVACICHIRPNETGTSFFWCRSVRVKGETASTPPPLSARPQRRCKLSIYKRCHHAE